MLRALSSRAAARASRNGLYVYITWCGTSARRLQLDFVVEEERSHHGLAVGRGTTLMSRISQAALLVIASLAPVAVSAAEIDASDVRISARATFSSQRVPETSDFDVKVAPADQLLQGVQALVIEGLRFPNQPNSQNAGFASSAGVVGGLFGVGVNGFHFQNSLPPNRYFASGRGHGPKP